MRTDIKVVHHTGAIQIIAVIIKKNFAHEHRRRYGKLRMNNAIGRNPHLFKFGQYFPPCQCSNYNNAVEQFNFRYIIGMPYRVAAIFVFVFVAVDEKIYIVKITAYIHKAIGIFTRTPDNYFFGFQRVLPLGIQRLKQIFRPHKILIAPKPRFCQFFFRCQIFAGTNYNLVTGLKYIRNK